MSSAWCYHPFNFAIIHGLSLSLPSRSDKLFLRCVFIALLAIMPAHSESCVLPAGGLVEVGNFEAMTMLLQLPTCVFAHTGKEEAVELPTVHHAKLRENSVTAGTSSAGKKGRSPSRTGKTLTARADNCLPGRRCVQTAVFHKIVSTILCPVRTLQASSSTSTRAYQQDARPTCTH